MFVRDLQSSASSSSLFRLETSPFLTAGDECSPRVTGVSIVGAGGGVCGQGDSDFMRLMGDFDISLSALISSSSPPSLLRFRPLPFSAAEGVGGVGVSSSSTDILTSSSSLLPSLFISGEASRFKIGELVSSAAVPFCFDISGFCFRAALSFSSLRCL